MTDSLKVKDNAKLAWLFIPLCISPLAFMGISSIIDNQLASLLSTMLIFVLYFTWLFRDMIKNQDVYVIEADTEGVYFKQRGYFKWSEISSVNLFTKTVYTGRHFFAERYLKINLVDQSSFSIETSNFDTPYEDIAKALRRLGGLD